MINKTVSVLIILLCFQFQLNAQIYISGSIKNCPKNCIVKLQYNKYNFYPAPTEIGSAMVDDDGHFVISAIWNKAGSAQLFIQDEYADLFISPGDSLVISVNYKKFDNTLIFAGRGANENNYLTKEYLEDFNVKPEKFFSDLTEIEYAKYVTELQRSNYEYFHAKNPADFTNDFIKYMRTSLKYRGIVQRSYYEFEKRNGSIARRKLTPEYYSFFDSLELNLAEALNNSAYTQALSFYTSYKLREQTAPIDSTQLTKSKISKVMDDYKIINSIFKGEVLEYQIMAYFLPFYLSASKDTTEFGVEVRSVLYEGFRNYCSNPEYNKIADRIVSKYKQVIKTNQALDIELETADGGIVSFSSLKGKVVFVDFWATWCKPCLKGLPDTYKLQNKFKDEKDIVFLYINLDEQHIRWIDYVKGKSLPGIQLYANKYKASQLTSYYFIDLIPRYLIINKKGFVINENADHDEKAEIMIRSALNEN